MDKYLVIGEIVRPQGVRGEVKLRPITCDVERFDGLEQAYFRRGEDFIPVHIRASRRAQEAVFLTLEGVEDRDAAEKLRGELLYIDRAHAVELDEDTNFLCDLIGLHGVDDEGGDLGTLRDVLQPGGNDVYVFNGPRGEVLVPALKSVVKKVDLEAGEMVLVAARLREQNSVCRTVQLGVRDTSLFWYERQERLCTPVCTAADLFQSAFRLYRDNRPPKPVRSLSVRALGLSPEEEHPQLSMFPEETRRLRRTDLERVMDKIREKYGYYSIQRGLMLTDPALNLDAKSDNTVHPIGFLSTL